MPNRSIRMAVLAALSSAGALSAPYALAGDIAFDGSLPGTTAGALNAVNGSYAITQDRGLLNGSNLFHSFDVFNLEAGDTAVFSGNATIANIISRVTGGIPTLIDGTIRSTINGANFWMVNPAGLTVGPNGAIDVSGAIALGAADSVDFATGQFFALPGDDDLAVSLLVSSPVDFGFLEDSFTGELVIQNGEFLARSTLVADNRQIQPLESNPNLEKFSLLLSGGAGVSLQSEGDLRLDDARVRTGSGFFTGPIDLTAVGSISISNSDLATSTPVDGFSGEISIQSGELVTISRSSLVAQSGGISVSAGEALTVDGALLDTSTASSAEEVSDPAGINLVAAGLLRVNNAILRSDASNGSSSGSIGLSGASAHIRGSTITTSTIGTQNDFNGTGGISVSADDTVLIEGSTLRANSTNNGSPTTDPLGGAAGKIGLGAGTLVRIEGSTIESSAKGVNGGAAGLVSFAGDAVDISNSSITLAAESLNPQVFDERNDGEPPSLQFFGGSFKLTNSTITATSSGAANAASLLLITSNGIEITDSTVQASTTGTGGAGAIFLFGFKLPPDIFDDGPSDPGEIPMVGNPFLRITNSTLASSTGGIAAPAGTISASIDGRIDLNGATLNVSATSRPELNVGFEIGLGGGSAGGIDLLAGLNPITVVDSTLQANTSGLVDGGGIAIDGSSLLLRGSTITASSSAPNQGTSLDPIFGPSDPLASAGAINLGLGNVSIVDVDMEDPDMPAPEPMFGDVIIESSTISTNALATNGGDISIVGAGTAFVLRDSSVLASAGGTGAGGDIAIFAMSEALVERSQLQALAEAGAGGTISIELNLGPVAPLTILSSNIATNATAADGGDIVLNSLGGNVLLRDSSVVASAGGTGIGGDISILNGNGATLQDSQVQALANMGTGGTITIALAEDSTGPLQIQNSQIATNATAADGGDISFDAMGNQLLLSGSSVVASAGGAGVGGDISILNVSGATLQDSQVQALADAGTGGTINIALDGSVLGTVSIDNSSITTNAMTGNGGSISLDAAANQVVMRGSSIVASAGGTGVGGDISLLNAGGVTLQDSQIQALANAGTGGTISIGLVAGVAGPASIVNSSITANAMNASGGNISFDAAGHQVSVRGSSIVASAGGSGTGGGISILNAAGASVQDSQFQALANAGTGGTISFTLANGAAAPLVFDNSSITTNAAAANGGNISLDAAGNQLVMRNSSIVASAGGTGMGGDISIVNVGGATLQNSQIQALANAGAGGTINLALADGVVAPLLIQNSAITTNAVAAGGGNISIDAAGNQLVMRDSTIRASAGAAGTGGNILIDNAGRTILQRSQILARADAGNGGTITINLITGALFIRDAQSTISADSNSGNDGAIDINSPDTDLNPAVKPQDVGIGSAPELSANACAPITDAARSTFVRENRGGVSASPDAYLASFETAGTTTQNTASTAASEALRVALLAANTSATEGCR